MEEQKTQLPYQQALTEAQNRENVARINAQGGIQERQLAEQGAMDRAKMSQEATQKYYDSMRNGAGGAGIRSFNPRSGAISMAPQAQMSNTLLANVGRAYKDAVKSGDRNGWFGQSNEWKVYDRLVQDALSTDPLAIKYPDLRKFAGDLTADPNFNENMTLDDLLNVPTDTGEAAFVPESDEELEAFRRIMTIMTGRPF
jgi:hypothetical protein